jgi:membrane-bound serine protease (ClpP class)
MTVQVQSVTIEESQSHHQRTATAGRPGSNMAAIEDRSTGRWPTRSLGMRGLLIIIFLAMIFSVLPTGNSSAQQPRIYTAELNGIFSELTADHTIRVLDRAESQEADALLLTVNSPGGLDRAVRRLNQAILASEIPVIAFVGPDEEAQALAGAFLITLAANKTAIHPGATIGSSPPPAMTDLIGPEEREARIEFASSIANRTAMIRGRDTEHVEAMIQQQVIFTAEEALDAGVVDAIAETPAEALAALHGETVQTTLGPVELNTDGARLIAISMTWWEITLRAITHASVAYALLSAGLLLLIVELFTPGRLIAGIPAVICLALAFVALGNLPVSWFGLGLMLLATILFIAELRTPWIGVAGAFGLVAYVAGSLSLYRPWGAMSAFAPDVSVNAWVIVGTMVGWVIVLLATLRAVFRARKSQLESSPPDLTGQIGVVIEALNPRGVVRVREQEWSAVSASGEIDPGTEVSVDRMASGILYVTPSAETAGSTQVGDRLEERSYERPAEPSP